MSDTANDRLELLRDAAQINALHTKGLRTSAIRKAQDVARRAKAMRHLVPYMISQFEINNAANGAFMPALGCEGGMAFIALIESPQRRTEFEADYPQSEYERRIVWRHVPAYHLLAAEMGEMRGFNSLHMQQCVADGMALCQRIGSPFVMSFHELATDITRSAGNIEQSLTHARVNILRRSMGMDRRWAAAKAESQTLLVAGRLDEALESATRAVVLAGTWYETAAAQLDSASLLQSVLVLLKRGDEFSQRMEALKLDFGHLRSLIAPRDETPDDHFLLELADSLSLVQRGECTGVIDSLIVWEKFLDERNCLSRWFEARLRRIAAQRMSGESRHQAEVDALAQQLTRRAEPARDILTLRRLEGMLDSSQPPSPYPFYQARSRPIIMLAPAADDRNLPPLAGACNTGFLNPVENSNMADAPDTTPKDPLLVQIDQIHALRRKCLSKSALRIAEETRRAAKSQQRLIPFLDVSFSIMNLSQNLMDPAIGRDTAMEAIALLESPERARAFQGDYDTISYDRHVQWMSACSYDNLAVAIARVNGYNSEGMQACIADGIAVCRRTGKLACITCFRDYATEVFRAADDLAMAQHHAMTNATKPLTDPRNDRRWVGQQSVAELALVQGELDNAIEGVRRALELAPLYHTPMQSRYRTACLLATILLLAGKESELDPQAAKLALGDADGSDPIAEGENPDYDMSRAQAQSLAAALRGDHDLAIEKLAGWDRWLTARSALSDWFEIRLRLIATHRFAGRGDRTDPMIRQLEQKATAARDFLTLRRLKLMLQPGVPACPFPPASPFTAGPFAATMSKTPVPATAATAIAGEATAGNESPPPPATDAAAAQAEQGPLFETINAISVAAQEEIAKSRQEQREPQLAPFAEQLLTIGAGPVEHKHDAGHLLFLAARLHFAFADLPALWDWATQLAGRFPQEFSLQTLLAELGNILRVRKDSPLAKVIKAEDLEAMFRMAMDKEPNRATVFARSAAFYLGQNDLAKAEQCLARASRLDRSDSWVAQRLAELYARSDRGSDGLTVLDLCLREGTADPAVLWDAAMAAFNLKRHELAVTYLNTLEKAQPGTPWTPYYQAQSLLELNRPAEAAEAIEREAQRVKGSTFHVVCVRAAVAAKSQLPELRERIAEALAMPLFAIDNMTPTGISGCLARLWIASAALPADDKPLREAVETRCLASGLIPAGMLTRWRSQSAKAANLHHYVCTLHQPLDDRWPTDPARLPRQEKWKSYEVRYGVLARSEDEARETVLAMQRRCAPLAAEAVNIEEEPPTYNDRPGVTWREYPTGKA